MLSTTGRSPACRSPRPLSSPVQWVFDKTRQAGLAAGQYLAVSLSAADSYVDVPAAALREQFLPALEQLFPAAAGAGIADFFVTRERRATFRQAPGIGAIRPGTATSVPGLVLAGAWTDTGWPDTMEGAVRSGEQAAERLTSELTDRPDTAMISSPGPQAAGRAAGRDGRRGSDQGGIVTATIPAGVETARDLVGPGIEAAVARLSPDIRPVASYHLGLADSNGRRTGSPAGGKALRPALALLSARAAGAPPERAVPAAVAVELVHNFSLLHDDIMDGDTERRHRPTAWTVFGVGPAILAGRRAAGARQ